VQLIISFFLGFGFHWYRLLFSLLKEKAPVRSVMAAPVIYTFHDFGNIKMNASSSMEHRPLSSDPGAMEAE
jgi:hypothetical protein